MSSLTLSAPLSRTQRRPVRRLFARRIVIGGRSNRTIATKGALARFGENRIATPEAALGHLVR